MPNIIIWADIPVVDMRRAARFYQEVLQTPVTMMPGTQDTVAVIGGPADTGAPEVSADLFVGGKPSHDGPTVYITSGGDIDATVRRVEAAGGTILQSKQYMGETVGWIAFFEDTEGNRIGIQQQ